MKTHDLTIDELRAELHAQVDYCATLEQRVNQLATELAAVLNLNEQRTREADTWRANHADVLQELASTQETSAFLQSSCITVSKALVHLIEVHEELKEARNG